MNILKMTNRINYDPFFSKNISVPNYELKCKLPDFDKLIAQISEVNYLGKGIEISPQKGIEPSGSFVSIDSKLDGCLDIEIDVEENPASDSDRAIGRGRKLYRDMLEGFVKLDDNIPVNATVVSIGCGRAHDAFVQSGYVGREPWGSDSKNVRFIGIDKSKESIDAAIHHYQDYDFDRKEWDLKSNYEFICGDARSLNDYIEGEIDVIFTSHPEVCHNNQVWVDIYLNAAEKHKPGGLLVSTFYMKSELEMAQTILKGNYDIEIACENPFTESVGSSGICFPHKYVLVARRK